MMETMSSLWNGAMGRNIKILILIFAAMIMIRNAWLCDDAYITLRTVDNFINGYGLRWNIMERVQTYTHPLWMFALTVPYAITREPYFSTIILSLLISVASVWVLLFRGNPSLGTGILVTVAMVMSKAFMDFTTSGLENPLSYLLIVGFVLVSFREEDCVSAKTLFRSSLLFALLLINRMDLIVLVGPLYGLLVYRAIWKKSADRRRLMVSMIQGWLPFVVWELFSLVYYGFLFPNTAYAKLNTGVPLSEYLAQGAVYYLNAIETDPVTILVLLTALAVAVGGGRAGKMVALGIALFLVYVLRVGGDFMATRFLSVPVFFACAALVRMNLSPWLSGGVAALFLLVGLLSPYNPVRSDSSYQGYYPMYQAKGAGINDERGFYYSSTGLLKAKKGGMPKHPWLESGERLRAQIPPGQRVVIELHSIGMTGYAMGPNVHAIDLFALGDPLLSRLNCLKDWNIGNFQRPLPAGYQETLQNGANVLWDANLREYFNKLRLLTAGSLWKGERLIEIIRFNVNANDHFLDDINAAPVLHVINTSESNVMLAIDGRPLGIVRGKWGEYWKVPPGTCKISAWTGPTAGSRSSITQQLTLMNRETYEVDAASLIK